MDVSSIRSLVTLVIQLHTIIIFAQALSEEGPKTKTRGGGESNHKPPCCYNGGLCVLGSFCHCPKNYYGRHCEHEVSEKPCGPIPHGSWLKAGCNLCRCYDGHMTCLPRAFDGCDDKPLTEEEPQNIWDYKDEMVIFARDGSTTSKYDAEDAEYYDYYENDNRSSSDSKHSVGARTVPHLCSMVLVCSVCVMLTTFWTSWRWESS